MIMNSISNLIVLFAVVIGTSSGFTVRTAPSSFHSASSTALRQASSTSNAAVRPDTSNAVEEALKISASFGIDSKEAKVAWDIVEEMDSSDNSEATKGSLNDECDISQMDQEQSIPCMDYGRFLDELYVIRDTVTQKGPNKKASLAETLKMIKLSKAEGEKVHSSQALTDALEAAKKVTADNGIASAEARLAWETYEEIAASGLDNAIGVNLAEECSLESGQEACQAIEELDRVMAVLLAISDNK